MELTKQSLGILQPLLRIKLWRFAFIGPGKGQKISQREENMELLYQLSPYTLVSHIGCTFCVSSLTL
jgi:hypothetical protein